MELKDDEHFGTVTLKERDEDTLIWEGKLELPSGTSVCVQFEGEGEDELQYLLDRGRQVIAYLVSDEDILMRDVSAYLAGVLSQQIIPDSASEMTVDEIRQALSGSELTIASDERGGSLFFDFDSPGDRIVKADLNDEGRIRSVMLE